MVGGGPKWSHPSQRWSSFGKNHHVRRRTEDVDYWRKRAGWFDDDQAMMDYNSGIYDTYYAGDGNNNGGSNGGRVGGSGASAQIVKNAIKALSVLVAIGLCVLLFRVISRRMGGESRKDKKSKTRSSSRSRGERSSSKSRSRSRSRSKKESGDYDLMEDKDEEKSTRSKRSSRSKSKSRRSSRSRSRTRARSRSKSRKEKEKSSQAAAAAEPVLV